MDFHKVDYLKGKKAAFSPFSGLPDQIKNIIHKELPFVWIIIFLLAFALLAFAGLKIMLNKNEDTALSKFNNVISAPAEQAYITIHLP